MFNNKWNRLALAALYLIGITVLFCLPGSAIPKNNWMTAIRFDKWVHVGFFCMLVVVWNWAVNSTEKKDTATILVAAAAYGIGVEVVQDQFISHRSFDVGDWVADMAGSFIGLWLWSRYIKK